MGHVVHKQKLFLNVNKKIAQVIPRFDSPLNLSVTGTRLKIFTLFVKPNPTQSLILSSFLVLKKITHDGLSDLGMITMEKKMCEDVAVLCPGVQGIVIGG